MLSPSATLRPDIASSESRPFPPITETIAVIDFETTGMAGQGARATEIAAVLVSRGQIVGQYQSLMRSGAWVPPFIEQLTGISNAMLADAPPAGQVMHEVLAFTHGCPLVAHNAPFDRSFWRAESALAGATEDPAHEELTPRFASVDLLETTTGRTVLLEHRQGHELLVVENFHDEGGYRVFELVVNGSRVRRWHIPRSPELTGRLEVGRIISLTGTDERFEAGLASSHLSCSLVPKDSSIALRSASGP